MTLHQARRLPARQMQGGIPGARASGGGGVWWGTLEALLGLWGLEVRLGQKYSWGASRGSIRAYWTALCLGLTQSLLLPEVEGS